ncbi:hypothetical protein [Streptomyces sp. XC 2026]|nr:hypothetical protein [Streptomyces sp. XC 2026]QQN79722.1 hypothetical protein IPZ77_21590 [Streptomyces sp. XC 2026]QQN80670.1 hypothetical protein IPZ77_27065 [Streptomyces sp. XC 2026]
MTHRTRIMTITAAAIASLLLAGCGGDSEDSKAAETPPAEEQQGTDEEAALEESVRAYTEALFAPDADTAYELLSTRCKDEISSTEFVGMADLAHQSYGARTIETVSIDQLSGDLARVSYTVGVPDLDREAQPWSREDGTWRWDAC